MYLQILGLFYCKLLCFTLELGACEPGLFVVSGVRFPWMNENSQRNPSYLGRDWSGN